MDRGIVERFEWNFVFCVEVRGRSEGPECAEESGRQRDGVGETIRDDESVRPPNGVAASEIGGGGGRKSEPQGHPLPPASLPQARNEPGDLPYANANPNLTSRATPAGEAAAQRATPGESGDRLDLQLQAQATARNKEHSQARLLLDGLSVITEGTSGAGAGAARNGNGSELRTTPPDEDEVPVQNLMPPRTSKRLRSADPHNKPRNEEDGPDGGPAAPNGFSNGVSNGHSYSLKATGGGSQLLLPPPPPPLAGRLDPSHIQSQGPPKPTMHAAHSYHNVNGASSNSDASNPRTERSDGKSDMPPMSLRIANLALFASSSDKASNLTSTSYSHLPPAGPTPYALLEDSTTF